MPRAWRTNLEALPSVAKKIERIPALNRDIAARASALRMTNPKQNRSPEPQTLRRPASGQQPRTTPERARKSGGQPVVAAPPPGIAAGRRGPPPPPRRNPPPAPAQAQEPEARAKAE